jgi:hypothetical protein
MSTRTDADRVRSCTTLTPRMGAGGALVLPVALGVGGVGVYRMRQGKGRGLLKVTLALSLVLLAAYVVAVWAMAGRPGG